MSETAVNSNAAAGALSLAPPSTENEQRLNYGVSCKGIDFGMLNARNQLIAKVCNPLLDMILKNVKADRATMGDKPRQKFTVNIVVVAERELDA